MSGMKGLAVLVGSMFAIVGLIALLAIVVSR